jgi:selenide,water dikinase
MRNIVFIGGGHSNTLAIRNLMQKIYKLDVETKNKILATNKFHLISEYKNSAYSGMIPGSICGYFNKSDSFIDLENFSEIHNCNFIQSKVIEIKPEENKILTASSPFEMKYDLLSINVGSKTYNNGKVKGVEEFAIQTRPISKLLEKIENFEIKLKEELEGVKSKIRIGIVGSGVAGIELGFSLRQRFKHFLNRNSEVTIFSNETSNFNTSVIPDFENNVTLELLDLASKVDIQILKNCECLEITKDYVIYQQINNKSQTYSKHLDLVIWATGAGAQDFNHNSNLKLDPKGFIRVKETLQSLDYPNIFGAGDCIQIEKYLEDYLDSNLDIKSYKPFPRKSGVYAVREGSVLADNFFKIINEDKDLIAYTPQENFLKLITMGDKQAFGTKFGISFYGRWVWNLKQNIDVNFVKMFTKEISCLESCNSCKNEKSFKEFKFTAENCIQKLKHSQQDEDFDIQLKILEKLNSDNILLNEVKNLISKSS